MPANIRERMRVTFRAEALDLLAELDASLLTLETEPGDAEGARSQESGVRRRERWQPT
jgi:hypothetical protein